MDEAPLTIRLESGYAVVSDDSGKSWQLPEGSAAEIRQLSARHDKPRRPGSLTAAALAGLGEAIRLRPDPIASHELQSPQINNEGIALGPHLLSTRRPLAEVLSKRMSERRFERPASLAELATVLVRAGRITGWRDDDAGKLEETRSLPSAGACTPIELELVTSGESGLPAGYWSFNPLHCLLVPVEGHEPSKVRTLLEERGISTHGGFSTILLRADFTRTLHRYPGGATLVWRDAGVLLGGLHLCAAEIGVGSCIIGSAGVAYSHCGEGVVDVGLLALGHQ